MTAADAPRSPIPIGHAVGLAIAGVVFGIVAAGVTASISFALAIALGQLALPAPALAYVLARDGDFARLGMSRPTRRSLAAGSLVGISFWVVLLIAIVPLSEALFDGEQFAAEMEQLLGSMSLLTMLVVLAVLPALCEELVFRGLLLRSIAARAGPVVAIGITSVLFALIHFDAVRFLATGLLGVAFGYLAWTSRSLWPAILAHFLNNACTLSMSQVDETYVVQPLPVTVAAAVAVSLLYLGLRLAHPPRR